MKKFIVVAIALTGMVAANASDSLAKNSQASADSISKAGQGTYEGTVLSIGGSIASTVAFSQGDAEGSSAGMGQVGQGSVDVVVASVTFIGDSAQVTLQSASDTYDASKEAFYATVEVSKEVGSKLVEGSKAVVKFFANTVGDSVMTTSTQMVLSLQDLSQGNLEGSSMNILLIPSKAVEALLTPDAPY